MGDCIGFIAYSKLSEKCQKCEYKDDCDKKQKESVGGFTVVEPCLKDCMQPLTQPILYDERQQKTDRLWRDIQKEIMKGGQH